VIEENINIDIEMNKEINEQEKIDEDHVLSDDSCFESDIEDDVTEIYRDLNQAEINTLSDFKKMCCIYFYYTQINVNQCLCSCIVRLSDLFSHLRDVRKHDTNPYVLIDGLYCSNCRNPLFQIMPCNMCPICTK